MTASDYWRECVGQAMEDAGVAATPEQINDVAASVQSGHENYSTAYPIPESPFPGEIRELRAALKREKDKVHCRVCNGHGTITDYGPGTLCSTSQCYKCHGEGRHV